MNKKIDQAIQEKIDSIHVAGVNRHRDAWFLANRVAAWATTGFGLSEDQFKRMVPLIVLRVLDAVESKTET